MSSRQARQDRSATLRAVLMDVQVADHWQPRDPTYLVDVAVRRWTSFDRRNKAANQTPENQIQDLLRGFKEVQGDDLIYEEPGWLEHVATCFGAALLAADQGGDAPAESGAPEGFTYRVRKNGDVELFHDGRPAGVLRGTAAARFLVDVDNGDPQQLMARLTGNYKHGNERTAANHPRNRHR